MAARKAGELVDWTAKTTVRLMALARALRWAWTRAHAKEWQWAQWLEFHLATRRALKLSLVRGKAWGPSKVIARA